MAKPARRWVESLKPPGPKVASRGLPMLMSLFLIWNYLGAAFLLYALAQFWKEGRRQGGRGVQSVQEGPTRVEDAKLIVIPKHNSETAPRGRSARPADLKKCG